MSFFWKIISALPKNLRHHLIRKKFKYPSSLPEGLIFKTAETYDEHEQAFNIIYEGYIERHLMEQNSERIRLTKWNCLPSTTIMICKDGDEVIGTIALISDSIFGLPTDEHRDLSSFRKQGLRLLEVSGLAIKKSNRMARGKLMLPLSKFMFEYAQKILKGDGLIISTVAEVRDFYEAIFLFRPLDDGKILRFRRVNNVKATSHILNFKDMEQRYYETFGKLPIENNIHHFFFGMTHREFQFPNFPYKIAINPTLTPELFRKFFIDRSDILALMSDKEKMYLSEYYHFPEFRELIGETKTKVKFERTSPRIPVRYSATVINSREGQIQTCEVCQIALYGLSLKIENINFNIGEKIFIYIDMEKELRVKVQGEIVWTNDSHLGVKLIYLPENWREMNEYAWNLIRKDEQINRGRVKKIG